MMVYIATPGFVKQAQMSTSYIQSHATVFAPSRYASQRLLQPFRPHFGKPLAEVQEGVHAQLRHLSFIALNHRVQQLVNLFQLPTKALLTECSQELHIWPGPRKLF